MDYMEENTPPPVQGRPQLLSVLCILTFIGTGLSILGCFIIPATSGMVIQYMQSMPGYDAQRDAPQIALLQAGWPYFMSTAALSLIALIGAAMMWKLRKTGFHLYTLSNIVAFFLPIIWLHMPFNILSAMVCAGFIGLYAVNLRFMK